MPTRKRDRRVLSSLLRRLARTLLEPHASVTDPSDCRRAKVLGGLLAVFIITSLSMALSADAALHRSLFRAVLPGIWLILYALSRSRHFRLAALLTVFVLAVPPFLNFYNSTVVHHGPVGPAMSDAFRWLAVPLAAGGVFLNLRGLLTAAGAILARLVITALAFPAGPVA